MDAHTDHLLQRCFRPWTQSTPVLDRPGAVTAVKRVARCSERPLLRQSAHAEVDWIDDIARACGYSLSFQRRGEPFGAALGDGKRIGPVRMFPARRHRSGLDARQPPDLVAEP